MSVANLVKSSFGVQRAMKASSSGSLLFEEPEWKGNFGDVYLEIIKDGVLIERISFPDQKSWIVCGRLSECDIHMEHTSVSRFHAVFQGSLGTHSK